MLGIKEIKALARETLLGHYGVSIGAVFLSGLMSVLCVLLTALSLLLSLANTNRFAPKVQQFLPFWKPVPALSVLFTLLFVFLLVFCAILSVWLKFGRQKLFLNICRGERYRVTDIFYGFRSGSHPFRIVALYVVRYIFIEINTLLPVFCQWMAKASGYRSNGSEADLETPWGIAIISVSLLTSLWMIWLSIGFSFSDLILIDRPENGVIDALKGSLRLLRRRKLKFLWFLISFFFWVLIGIIVPLVRLWIDPFVSVSVILFYLSAGGEEAVIPAFRAREYETASYETMPEEPVIETVQALEEPFRETPGEVKEAGTETDGKEQTEADGKEHTEETEEEK